MSDNPLENLIRLQLVALTEMRKQLRDQNSKLTRLENKVDSLFITTADRKSND